MSIETILREHREDPTYPDTCVCETYVPADADAEGHYAAHLAELIRDALTGDEAVEAVARAIFVVLEPAPNAQGDRDRQTRLRLVAMRQSREAARVAIAAQGETIGGK